VEATLDSEDLMEREPSPMKTVMDQRELDGPDRDTMTVRDPREWRGVGGTSRWCSDHATSNQKTHPLDPAMDRDKEAGIVDPGMVAPVAGSAFPVDTMAWAPHPFIHWWRVEFSGVARWSSLSRQPTFTFGVSVLRLQNYCG